MDDSLFIITIFRHYALNYIKYTITCHKLFSVSFFTRNNSTYNLLSKSDFVIPQVSTVFKGPTSISYYGPIICSLVPEKIRYTDSLKVLKVKQERGSLRIAIAAYAKTTFLMMDF